MISHSLHQPLVPAIHTVPSTMHYVAPCLDSIKTYSLRFAGHFINFETNVNQQFLNEITGFPLTSYLHIKISFVTLKQEYKLGRVESPWKKST